jgi:integral membrane sensor domain MASE1
VRTFGRYLREVLGTGWGILFVIAGAVSTSATFVLIYRPDFVLPYWVPGALSIAAWLIAPYRLY